MDHGLSVDMLDDVDNTTKLLQVQEPVLNFFLQYQPSIIKTLHIFYHVSSVRHAKKTRLFFNVTNVASILMTI